MPKQLCSITIIYRCLSPWNFAFTKIGCLGSNILYRENLSLENQVYAIIPEKKIDLDDAIVSWNQTSLGFIGSNGNSINIYTIAETCF